MKVLFLCGGDQKYGTLHMALSIVSRMSSYRQDISFIVLTQQNGMINEKCDEMGIENYAIPYRYCVYKQENYFVVDFIKRFLKGIYVFACNAQAMRLLRKQIDIKSIDLVHTNINRDLFGGFIAKKYRIPHVVHLREFSKAHFDLSLLFPRQLNFMNHYTNCFVAISEAVLKDWETFGIDKNKTSMIYDGVDSKEVSFQEEKRISDPIKIVMSGGIYAGKGQHELISAAQTLKEKGYEFELAFFGDYGANRDYYDMILSRIKQYNLEDCVHMMGYQENVRERIGAYDIGVVCSTAEGFGLVTVEYMLAGLCPVVSDTGANPELVQDEQSGLIYRWGEPEDLAEKLERLIQNPDMCRRLAKNARSRALERFSLADSVKRLSEVYDEVCSK